MLHQSFLILTDKKTTFICVLKIYLIFEQRNIQVDDIMKIFKK